MVRRLADLYERYKALRAKENKFSLEALAFEQQRLFVLDSSRLKALFCTRRAAKSYTGGLYLIQEALKTPGCNCLFIGLTRQSAHGIIWKDILRTLDRENNLNIKFNETLLTATLPNGSVIWVTGADTDEQEMNKLLGKKYKLVIIDEASMYTINTHQLVYGVLKPATADQRGSICLLGTASNITRGLFYDITTGREPGWSVHTWTAYDNPHVKTQWEEEIKEIEEKRPLFKDTPLFKQWYLNQWVVDEDALVYKFNRDRDTVARLPQTEQPYHYVLGIDLGHSPDPSAFVVGAYHEHIPSIWIVHTEKHFKMDITSVSDKVKELDRKYKFEAKVIDGSMKMAIEEMNTRHQTGVIPADKQGKEHWINLFNDEFTQERIKFVLPHADELCKELETLVWVTDNGSIKIPRKEEPSLPNHCTDAMLYMLRYTHSYLSKAIPNVKYINWNAQEEWEPRHLERMTQEIIAKQNPNHLDLPHEELEELFNFEQDDVI
jgi:hypothetical protein